MKRECNIPIIDNYIKGGTIVKVLGKLFDIIDIIFLHRFNKLESHCPTKNITTEKTMTRFVLCLAILRLELEDWLKEHESVKDDKKVK